MSLCRAARDRTALPSFLRLRLMPHAIALLERFRGACEALMAYA
jgi:hypothetical protein